MSRSLVAGTAMLLSWAFLAAAPAFANEQSQALGARALIELNAGHARAAIEILDRALAADPADADAHFLRGTARAQTDDYEGAIEDLRAALAIQPDLGPAQLELGVALSETGHYAEALPWLQRAEQRPPLAARAAFYVGICQLRLDYLDDAQASFARARAGDPSLDLAAQYYDGVIAFRRTDLETAEMRFTSVQQASPDSAIGRESAQFLDLIHRSQRRAYSVSGTVALEYDSNVTLGPTTAQLGASGQGDGRVALAAGGRYVPWRRGPASLSIGYDFFQSLQFTLTEFDLQDHRPSVELQFDFPLVSFGLLARYDYYLLETSSFLQETTAFPWVSLHEEGVGHTDFYLRSQWRHYYQTGSAVALLNGYYNFVGLRQFIGLGAPSRELWFGYQTGVTSPTNDGGSVFQYVSNEFEVGLRWPLPYLITAQTAFRYEHQNYNANSRCFPAPSSPAPPAPPVICNPLVPTDGSPRRDNDYRVIVSFERPLSEISEHLFVVASWFGTWNNSNNTNNNPDGAAFFEYTRQIGSLGAEVRF